MPLVVWYCCAEHNDAHNPVAIQDTETKAVTPVPAQRSGCTSEDLLGMCAAGACSTQAQAPIMPQAQGPARATLSMCPGSQEAWAMEITWQLSSMSCCPSPMSSAPASSSCQQALMLQWAIPLAGESCRCGRGSALQCHKVPTKTS